MSALHRINVSWYDDGDDLMNDDGMDAVPEEIAEVAFEAAVKAVEDTVQQYKQSKLKEQDEANQKHPE